MSYVCDDCHHVCEVDKLDFDDKRKIHLGMNTSWGNWNVYKIFIKCPSCEEYKVLLRIEKERN